MALPMYGSRCASSGYAKWQKHLKSDPMISVAIIAIYSDLLYRCIMYWGEISTVNDHLGYCHIRPVPDQEHHPPGNVFAHFYENPRLEGLLF